MRFYCKSRYLHAPRKIFAEAILLVFYSNINDFQELQGIIRYYFNMYYFFVFTAKYCIISGWILRMWARFD